MKIITIITGIKNKLNPNNNNCNYKKNYSSIKKITSPSDNINYKKKYSNSAIKDSSKTNTSGNKKNPY